MKGSIGRESTSVRVLLLSSDIQIIETFCGFAQEMAIHVEPCCDTESAMRKLCHEKYEGVLIDLDSEGALDVPRKIRAMTSNRAILSFAVASSGDTQAKAFHSGVNFVLERPLMPRSVLAVLKASYPMMVRERRRYFRCPLQVSVFVTRRGEPEFTATSLNLSESGICLNSPSPMQVGDRLRLRLCLPGRFEFVSVTGEVCWSERMGRVGIQFSGISDTIAQAFRNWLSDRLEEMGAAERDDSSSASV